MDQAPISQSIEQLVGLPSASSLKGALPGLLELIGNSKTGKDSKESKKGQLNASLSVETALKRCVLSSAIDEQSTQKNALILYNFLLQKFGGFSFENVFAFINQNLSVGKSVTKGEKKYFNFSHVSLLFPLLAVVPREDSALVRKIVDKLAEICKSDVFSLLVLSGLLYLEKKPSDSHVVLIKRVYKQCSENKFQMLDFLLSAKNALYTIAASTQSKDQKKEIVELIKDLTHKVKLLLSFGALSQIFESLRSDPHFSGRYDTLPTFDKVAEFIFRGFSSRKAIFGKLLSTFLERLCSSGEDEGTKRELSKTVTMGFLLLFDSIFTHDSFDFDCVLEVREEQPELVCMLFDPSVFKDRETRTFAAALEKAIFAKLEQQKTSSFNLALYKYYFLSESKSLSSAPKGLLKLLKSDRQESLEYVLSSLSEVISEAGDLESYQLEIQRVIFFMSALSAGSLKDKAIDFVLEQHRSAPEVVRRFAEDLKEQSESRLTEEIQSGIHEKLFQRIFQNSTYEELAEVARKWIKANGEKADLFPNVFHSVEELKAREKTGLGKCLLACLLQNYQSEEKDHTTMLLNQVVDDLAQFSEKFCAQREPLNSEDHQVLTDALLCLIGIENAHLRASIKLAFQEFAEGFDDACLGLVEDAFFSQGNHLIGDGDTYGDEDDFEGSDIEIKGKLL